MLTCVQSLLPDLIGKKGKGRKEKNWHSTSNFVSGWRKSDNYQEKCLHIIMYHIQITKNRAVEFPGKEAIKGCVHLSNPISLILFSPDLLESGSLEFQSSSATLQPWFWAYYFIFLRLGFLNYKKKIKMNYIAHIK